MEKWTPPSCPSSVTLRRNPNRRSRKSPLTTVNFAVDEIPSMDLHPPSKPSNSSSDSLRVFLRIRPKSNPKLSRLISNKEFKSCVVVNDCCSVKVTPPCDYTRAKSEFYNGFSYVFEATSSQDDVYDKLMRPIVEEFLNGKSGLLAALGPSGSGKTHTVFGSAQNPGLLPRALRHIFEQNGSNFARSFYMSVFEIISEKGKREKLCDLSPDGTDISMQQSLVVGLKEVLISDVAQAESLLAYAKTKRATAATNSNSQSSRSQCIINLRSAIDEMDGDSKSHLNGTVLTFVDLAGAEREKKTRNQGGSLLESNFINKTSMVFGLCLRSLLEHQKNPKKPLQKHFQSSLLTRYLRDYLEGRKRMALILTIRCGEEDYFDTSFLLRQASPYTEIKFNNVEEVPTLAQKKRPAKIILSKQRKKVKLSDSDICKDHGVKTIQGSNETNNEPEASYPGDSGEREHQITRGLAKAFLNVLKEYKEKVKTMENEINVLTDKLRMAHDRHLAMEKEVHDLRSQITSSIEETNSNPRVSVAKESTDNGTLNMEVCEFAEPECREENPPLDRETSAMHSSEVQDGTMASEVLRDVVDVVVEPECCRVDDVANDVIDSTAAGTATSLPEPLVKDLTVQGEGSAQYTNDEEKENVSMDHRTKISFEAETKLTSVAKPLNVNAKRPKRRRLMPASTLLLRDVSDMDICVESENPKRGGGGRKRMVEDEMKQTRGNASLIRLLKNHLPL